MMVPWFYPRDSWQSFIRLATHCLWYPSFDVSTAAVAILESVAEPNLTSEKVRCETTAVFDIPNCWHIYCPQYFTSYDLSTKTTSLYKKSYKKICAKFTSRTTIYRLTSLTSWQLLALPDLPLQQGSDQLNCNSKHLLMLYEYLIKLYCVYINEQRVGIFWCNLRFESEPVWPHLRRRS